LSFPKEQTLSTTNASIALLFGRLGRPDLEYPWTLTMEVCKTAETGKRGVILSSELAEICSDFSRTEEQKTKDAAGKEIKTKVTRTGIGVVRAAGAPGADPASSHLANDVSRICGAPLSLSEWTTLTLVGERGRTTLYVNGAKAGECGEQIICPLAMLGSRTGNSFVGKVRNVKVHNRALSPREIGRAAGLDAPDNLAARCPVKASASDAANGFTPENITDENPGTRWSSGITSSEQSVTADLGQPREFNTVRIAWEAARPGRVRIQISNDGMNWKEVFTGAVSGESTVAALPSVTASQVRLVMCDPVSQWGYSIWELEVFKRRAGTQ